MADIGALSFGSTVNVLNEAIAGASLQNVQIANNLANVNTPDYRRSTTSFKAALAASLGTPASGDQLALVTNDPRQFALNGAAPPVPFDPKPHVDESTRMRVDGSNVDVDKELAGLQANSGYSQTMTDFLTKQYAWLREAITEQLN